MPISGRDYDELFDMMEEAFDSVGADVDIIENDDAVLDYNAATRQIVVSLNDADYDMLVEALENTADLLSRRIRERSSIWVEYESQNGEVEMATLSNTMSITATLRQAATAISSLPSMYKRSDPIALGMNIL